MNELENKLRDFVIMGLVSSIHPPLDGGNWGLGVLEFKVSLSKYIDRTMGREK